MSQAVKLFDIIQFKQLKLTYAQYKISYAENCYNEHYENIIQETETEKLNNSKPLYTKRSKGEQIKHQVTTTKGVDLHILRNVYIRTYLM